MVDVVVNNVMATSTTPDLSTFMFKDEVHLPRYYTRRLPSNFLLLLRALVEVSPVLPH